MPLDQARPFRPLNIAVLTVSDSRSLENDKSGDLLTTLLREDGHMLADRRIVCDDRGLIAATALEWANNPAIDVVLTTGGTGVTGRDVTPEALRPLWEKEIPGFGELFRWQGLAKIGTSTVQSRATAGLMLGTYMFVLPGSPGACRDAWEGILRSQLDIRHRPCNFAELIPRLRER